MNDLKECTIYPVVSPNHWACPACGHNGEFQARNGITEYRSYSSPMIVRPNGAFAGDLDNGESGDIYESEFHDDYACACFGCGEVIPYDLKPVGGSVADFVRKAELGIDGVKVLLHESVPHGAYLTCDSDGMLKNWSYPDPACSIEGNRAVWRCFNVIPEQINFAGIISPRIAAAIPDHMLHMVGWMRSGWDDSTTGRIAGILRDLKPLPVGDGWWKIQLVKHKLLY
jgi:hypothetical protein